LPVRIFKGNDFCKRVAGLRASEEREIGGPHAANTVGLKLFLNQIVEYFSSGAGSF